MKRCMQAASLTYQAEADVETESDTESLPDQRIKPEEYETCSATHHRSTQYC